MKRAILFFFALCFLTQSTAAYRILYSEQYYKLYHLHFYQAPDDTLESIYYLEQALKADFCNPLYALAKIETKPQWEHYRYLFKMHVNLKLVQLNLTLASQWDKQIAYFYNEPWKTQNLESLKQAESLYKFSLVYWNEALSWAKKAHPLKFHLPDIQNWEDENFRIASGELDYQKIIDGHLKHLQKVRATFEAMDENTY